ncbi:GNAT family N-acetyltransferase [bacterium]|nr:GNAT family N-acetyltransferase [bacterium]
MLSLRPFTIEDIPRLIQEIPDRRFLMQWAGPLYQWPLTGDQILHHLQNDSRPPGRSRIFKAVTRKNDTVGTCELAAIDPLKSSARLSRILIYRHARNRGLGIRMLDRLLRIAFEEMRLCRLALNVFDFNHAAIRCYEHLGFQREAVLENARQVEAEFWNSIIMALRAEEWRKGTAE